MGAAVGIGLVYVELISPYMTFVYLTYALAYFARTSLGEPEVVAHGPRALPGLLGSPEDESSPRTLR